MKGFLINIGKSYNKRNVHFKMSYLVNKQWMPLKLIILLIMKFVNKISLKKYDIIS